MNKKVLAIAVVAAMSASAAQADVKFFGGLQAEIGSVDDGSGNSGLTMGDVTTQKGNKGSFGAKWTDGDFFGKINFNSKIWGGAANGTAGTGTRDVFVGMKMGGGKIQAGTYSSAYKTTGSVKIDPFLSTGLQSRSSGGGQGAGSGGYVTAIGYRGAVGPAKIAVDFAPEMQVCSGSTSCGTGPSNAHLAVGASMDMGNINVFFGMDDFKSSFANATNSGKSTAGKVKGASVTKFGAKMKMGKMKIAAQIETGMTDYAGTTSDTLTFVSLSMPMGGMTLGAWIGLGDETSLAVGVKKAMTKKTSVYAGYRSTGITGGAATGIIGGLRTAF